MDGKKRSKRNMKNTWWESEAKNDIEWREKIKNVIENTNAGIFMNVHITCLMVKKGRNRERAWRLETPAG